MSCCGLNLDGLTQKQAVDAISRAVAARGMTPCLSRCLDQVLGTTVESEVDAEAEAQAFREFQKRQKAEEA